MPNPRLAARYAKSLLDLAKEQGRLEQVYADMQLLQTIVRSSREFANLLRSPIVSADKKEKIVNAVLDGKVTQLTAAFVKLLINKGREEALPEIIPAFIQQYKDLKNIHTIKLTTAVPVSEELKKAIVEQVRKTSNLQNIELETTVNPNLIGGFTLQAGDKLVDASIANDLKEIRRQFESNDYLYKVI